MLSNRSASKKVPSGMFVLMVGAEEERLSSERGPEILGIGDWLSWSRLSWVTGVVGAGGLLVEEEDNWGAGEPCWVWCWDSREWRDADEEDGATLWLCFFVRFMGGESLRLKPLISLLVEGLSLIDSLSEMSDSESDQRLWQE